MPRQVDLIDKESATATDVFRKSSFWSTVDKILYSQVFEHHRASVFCEV